MHLIRPASQDDIHCLPALEAAADALLVGVLGPAFTALPAPPPLPESEASLCILVSGSPPRGFARVEKIDGQAHLEQLSVHPDHGGEGLGRALVRDAVQWARVQGFTIMTLCTYADIPFNAPFYATCGFEVFQEAGPELAVLRSHEKHIGLDRLGRRLTMRIRL